MIHIPIKIEIYNLDRNGHTATRPAKTIWMTISTDNYNSFIRDKDGILEQVTSVEKQRDFQKENLSGVYIVWNYTPMPGPIMD